MRGLSPIRLMKMIVIKMEDVIFDEPFRDVAMVRKSCSLIINRVIEVKL